MTVVRVVVTRTGGFAGLSRTAEVDDPEQAGRIDGLLRGAGAGGGRDGATRDGFVYAFTVISTTHRRTVELTTGQLPAELRPVVADLVDRAG